MNTSVNRSICLYFQVHQPMRLKKYRFFDIGADHYYYDDFTNRSIVQRVAKKSYLPANAIILDLIKKTDKQFKVSFSLSGTVIQQLQSYAPEVIKSFQELADTGCVEFLCETSAHSLASMKDVKEFERQVHEQSELIKSLFGQEPIAFRNTELIYSDEIGSVVSDMGFKTMLLEGAKHILGWKSPNYIYSNPKADNLKLLLRNYHYSDDIAFRFSNRSWSEWPLTSDKFASWLNAVDKEQPLVNLFMDYETFGEHQWEETGIMDFLRVFPEKVINDTDFTFRTISEASELFDPIDEIDVPMPMSWADEERDLTAWLGNDLQDDAFNNLYRLSEKMAVIEDVELIKDWDYLQNSDHFYYMCTKWFSDGDVHDYFTPYDSPYDAYINYMNVLADFTKRVEDHVLAKKETTKVKAKSSPKKKAGAKKLNFSDIKNLSVTKLKNSLRGLEKIELYHLLQGVEGEMKEVIEKQLGKRTLSQMAKYVENKEKSLKKDFNAVKKKLEHIINE